MRKTKKPSVHNEKMPMTRRVKTIVHYVRVASSHNHCPPVG